MNRRSRWVAPKDDGQVLIDPPCEALGSLLSENRQRVAHPSVFGTPLQEWRRTWRQGDSHAPWVVTGHQPDWVHPGVWLKHFAVHHFAQRLSGRSMHVSIDTDVPKGATLALPRFGRDPHDVTLHTVAYDQWETETIWSAISVREPQRFLRFPESVAPITRSWPFQPILTEFWRRLSRWALGTSPIRLAALLNAVRRSFEAEWGVRNEELDAHELWEQNARPFFTALVRDLPRFRDVYNKAVRTYRQRYGVRSRQHPVPELVEVDGYLEAPFWFVQGGRRLRGFWRRDEGHWQVRIGSWESPRFADQGCLVQNIVEEWGFQVYPRALLTTLMLRLFLADLFIHGIGGAKYDEVTDDIIRSYFQIEPPEYLVVSGTLRLPFPLFPSTENDFRRIHEHLRQLRWHPERFLDHRTSWVEQKERWLQYQPRTRADRKTRYRELLELTESLRPLVEPQRLATQTRLDRIRAELAANALLSRRDFAWIFQPAERLRHFCTQLTHTA